ncbi:hypothetical protein G6737_01040 [Polynucleobacter paneuropaeus]|nr:hypothetical protein [Polynucleobacter paneuropaeus]MBT8521126.1 hypothetical protein [Polynucleobacter paneuropaeus]MBT8538580.1 hypothetical protein [Polynucleobacter paneuropaeus]RAZ47720.1 hypothetical protein DP175_05685 [Polynucleobacter paneuropaeus]
MKKISLVLLCLLSALPILAHANWTEMGVSNGKSLYIDQTKTASIDGATKRAVILLSFVHFLGLIPRLMASSFNSANFFFLSVTAAFV